MIVSRTTAGLFLIRTLICISLFVGFARGQVSTEEQHSVSTPLPGSTERKAILDALRDELYAFHGVDVVFVVRHLNVARGWAWVHASPQSRDAVSHYEDVSALIRKTEGRWQVAEIACSDDEDPECLGSPDFFSKLRERFPGLPPRILP